MQYLRASPEVGAFDAVELLSGSKTSDVLVDTLFLKPRPVVTKGAGKRPYTVWDEGDNIVSSSASASTKHRKLE